MLNSTLHISLKATAPALLVLALCVTQALPGQVITVKQDGSGDFVQIQPAIDASQNGDTVLVWPGTYVENLKMNHKGITLASLHLTSNDPAYIDQTIIDGNQTNSSIYYDTVSHPSLLQGFTITNGQGNGSTSFNPGGGIQVRYSNLDIKYCKVKHNRAGNGGGILIYSSEASIAQSIIEDNFANQSGGGLYIQNAEVSLSKSTIRNNHCYIKGGGIVIGHSGIITFDSINPCNIYYNYASEGTEIWKVHLTSGVPPLKLFVDTFTVLIPDHYHLYSGLYDSVPNTHEDYFVSVLNGKTQMVNNALYVNPAGNDTNSGLSPDEPLQHLAFALAKIVSDSSQRNTIHLAEGTYSPSNGEKYPLSTRSYVDIVGAGPESTVLDAEHTTTHFVTYPFYKSFNIEDLAIVNSFGNYHGFYNYWCGISLLNNTDVYIRRVHFRENLGKLTSGCAISESNNIHIEECVFEHNHGLFSFNTVTSYAYSPYLFRSDSVFVVNTSFINNQPPGYDPNLYGGSGPYIQGTDFLEDSLHVYFINCEFIDQNHFSVWPQYAWSAMGVTDCATVTAINCTFSGNHSENENVRALGITADAEMSLYNCIVYNNPPGSMYMYSRDEYAWDTCKLNVHYSLFEGGEEEILQIGYKNAINYAASNIDTDPLFYNSGEYPYYLLAGSPCIDAGTLELPPGVVLPETDLAGNPRVHNGYIDMGAYEHGPWVGVPGAEFRVPSEEYLRCYPNPFSQQTTIQYQVPEAGRYKLKIYDMKGRCLKTLMDVTGQAGSGEISWDGKDIAGKSLPSGTYIITLSINGKERDALKIMKN